MKRLYPFNVGFYLANVNSFSPHTSDSEGTSAYKKLRREMLDERQELLIKITELKDEMFYLRKNIAQKDQQMKSSTSLAQKLDQVSEEVRRLKEKLAQSEGKVRELEEENQIKEDLLLQKQRPSKEQLFGKSLY